MTDTSTSSLAEQIKSLRSTPNWLKQDNGDFKSAVSRYDRAPFTAADTLTALLSERSARLNQPAPKGH